MPRAGPARDRVQVKLVHSDRMGVPPSPRKLGFVTKLSKEPVACDLERQLVETSFYPVVVVPETSRQKDEPLGSKPKHWYQADDSTWHIFKQARPGEDWSEKVACEVAALLGIPHADVEFASFGQVLGVSSPSFVPTGASLIHGNELMSEVVPAYSLEQRWRVSKHTLDNALKALDAASPVPPPSYFNRLSLGWTELFSGYLMLDALIGNTDRHHENWAVIRHGKVDYLAPSYDHAASLGRNEPDRTRAARLDTADPGYSVEAYAGRARSAFYKTEEDTRPMATMDVFAEVLERYPTASVWLECLERVTSEQLSGVFDRIPDQRISLTAKAFALRMLGSNRERLLSLWK